MLVRLRRARRSFRNLDEAAGRARPRAHGRPRARTAPARRTCSRRSTSGSPGVVADPARARADRASAPRWRASRLTVEPTGPRRAADARLRRLARRGAQPPRRRQSAARRRARRCAGGRRLHARPAGAGQGAARPRGAPTSTGSSRRCGRRAPSCGARYGRALAQRNACSAGSAPARPTPTRSTPGIASSPTEAAALVEARADARSSELAPPFAPPAASSASTASASSLPAAHRGARRRRRSSPSCASAATATSRAGTDLRAASRRGRDLARRPLAAPLRLAGPAARRRCWRCCSPSARRCSRRAGSCR